MAEIDTLLARIADKKLKQRLEGAVKKLRDNKSFGLVYESHVPEQVALHGLPVKVGATVQLRREPTNSKNYRVTAITTGNAVLADEDGNQRTEAVTDLLVVKGFGEPMYAALESAGSEVRAPGAPHHALISGENYHALQLLLYLYEGQVDCIYIDPPYNTGAADWRYNNRFVDDNDSYRHSKWLSMMEKRLRLAKRLLRTDGVLIVTIDEYELHRLGLLLQNVFKGWNQYMVSIVTNSRGSTGATGNFGVIEEQALFVVPKGLDIIEPREAFIPHLQTSEREQSVELSTLLEIADAIDDLPALLAEAGLVLTDEQRALFEPQGSDPAKTSDDDEDAGAYWTSAQRTGQGTSFRTQRPRQFYPIFVDEEKGVPVRAGEPLLAEVQGEPPPEPSYEKVDGLIPVWPIDQDQAERVWCFQPSRMNDEIKAGNLKVGRFNKRRNSYSLSIRRVRQTEARFRERSIWWHPSYDAGSNGTTMLTKLLGKSGLFNFPKSVYATRDTLATVVGSRPDALIVDFFAGSATTLHATMLLNALDGGSRRAIAVTNNEVDPETGQQLNARDHFVGDTEYEAAGIFEQVAMPRVKAALTGENPSGQTLTGKYRWADDRPMKAGFEENVEFFRMRYLDPDEVDLGHQLEAIIPLLWLAAGGIGNRESPDTDQGWVIPESSTYGLLLRESRFRPFSKALAARPDVTHVWLVTDSPSAFAEMSEKLPRGVRASMLYRDYLRNFQINVEAGR